MFRPMRPAILISSVLVAGIIPSTVLRAQFQNPITAAKDAYKKAKEQQQQQQRSAQTPGQTQSQSGQKPPGNGSAPASTSASSSSDAAPWVPPSDGASGASGSSRAAAAVKLAPARLPDILGIHLGMTAQEALAATHKAYPDDMYVEMKVDYWPTAVKPDYGYNIHSRAPGNFKNLSLSFTAPPAEQTVWRIQRQTQKLHTNHNTLIAALRDKYGKESFAWQNGDTRTRITNDNQITGMLWLYDEQGNHVPMPDSTVFTSFQSFEECTRIDGTNEPIMPKDDDWAKRNTPWCASHFVALIVTFSPTDIVENTQTMLEDIPLAVRTAHAADVWMRDLANRLHQEDLQRSKENKPTL
jgi:hypothetical protein